jgi:hypothetical protein
VTAEQRQRIASLEQAAQRVVDAAQANRLELGGLASQYAAVYELHAPIVGLRAVLEATSAPALAAAWRDEPLEGGSGS